MLNREDIHEILNDWELAIQEGYGIPVAIGKQRGIIEYFRELHETNVELKERLRKAERHMQLDLDALEVASRNYGMPCSLAITRLKEALAELSPSHDE